MVNEKLNVAASEIDAAFLPPKIKGTLKSVLEELDRLCVAVEAQGKLAVSNHKDMKALSERVNDLEGK